MIGLDHHCPTKNSDRNKLIIEKATEIGVTDFFPLISQNSERRKWNTEKFEKILIFVFFGLESIISPFPYSPLPFIIDNSSLFFILKTFMACRDSLSVKKHIPFSILSVKKVVTRLLF